MNDEARASLILIVEDDQGIRETLKHLLETENFEVATAENGSHALKMLSSIARPCLVLLDLSMPIMDGSEFLTIIRTSNLHHMLATIPVIIQTAEYEPSPDAVKLSHGLIKKPFDFDVVLNVVKKYCRKK